MRRSLLLVSLVALPVACLSVGALPPGEKKVLDHEDYARWRTLEEARLSRKGGWLSYRLQPPGDEDAVLVLRATAGEVEHRVERGRDARVGYGERWAVCRVRPEREALREAERDDVDEDEQPVGGLAIVDLASGEVEAVERVKSFALPKRAGGVVAWLHEEPLKDEEKEEEEGEEEPEEEEEAGEAEAEGEEEEEELTPAEKQHKKREEKKKKAREDGTELVLRDLASGEEQRFEHVLEYALSEDGRWLAMTTSTKDDGGDGVILVDRSGGTVEHRNAGAEEEQPEGEYTRLAFDEGSTRLAWLTNADAYADDPPRWSLYTVSLGDGSTDVVQVGDGRLADGWGVSPHRAPRFSEDGARLFFGTAPLPAPEPDEVLEEDEVVVDVWSWTDDLVQPHQLEQLKEERERSYLAVLHAGGALAQLGTLDVPEVRIDEKGHTDVALGTSNLAYRRALSWDTYVPSDGWAIDVGTGERTRLYEGRRGSTRLSPGGRHVWWWDPEGRAWFAQPSGGGAPVNLTGSIPQRFDDEEHDTPSLPRAHGAAGWLAGDRALLVYDRYDLWLLDPTRPEHPACVTEGEGRSRGIRLRWVDTDPEEEAIDPSRPLLLSALADDTKAAGFFLDGIQTDATPQELVLSAHRYSTPARAAEAEVVRYTRESYGEFGDLWLADAELNQPRKVSDANPQQAEYAWGTAELVAWTSTTGERLEGILYKPEGFDPAARYPLITYFYERNSDNLHAYHPPTPHRSIIRFPFYASRGYLVFVPDIPYEVGYPGQSAVHAVLPGVAHLIEQGFVDEAAIGVQGHSWGGYQAAFLITQTDLFAAAVAGAVVSNMTSAYGGVRWESGMSRMFQYERTQSRIGGTLWEETPKYLDNSPLFYAERVETPLLMMHNDEDGAVPWYQGIELFMALRRLDKPVWMLNYNGQPHWVTTWATQQDYARRMQQFFDHHLKGAPPARWMVEGVPAVEKGRSLGLELVGEPAGG